MRLLGTCSIKGRRLYKTKESGSIVSSTYMTPLDDGLLGQAKKRRRGKFRERPAFQDMMEE
eukprot:scaffold3559_cov284-Chaetoceros_neogracile.AAC.35